MSNEFETREGELAAQAHDGDWLQPTVNPFGHGCCGCGLFHQVEWRLVDGNGEEISHCEETHLQLRFIRDEGETARLRAHKDVSSRQEQYRAFVVKVAAMDPAEHYIGDHGMGHYEDCGQCEALIEEANQLLDVKEGK